MAHVSTDEHPVMSGGGETTTSGARVAKLEEKVDNLLVALASQRLIGTAVGLLAERESCRSDVAWDLLAKISQDTNVKVRDVARVLVDSHDGTVRPEDAELLAKVRNRPI